MNSKKGSRPRVLLVNRAIVLSEENTLLLIQRASKNETYLPGKWEVPGGKLEMGQDIANALEREVFEETGLLVIPTTRLAYYESYLVSEGPYKGLNRVVLVGITKVSGNNTVRISEEHDDFTWVTYKDALTYDLTPETRKALQSLEKQLPE